MNSLIPRFKVLVAGNVHREEEEEEEELCYKEGQHTHMQTGCECLVVYLR